MKILFLTFITFSLFAQKNISSNNSQKNVPEITPVFGYKIVNVFPHDNTAFTQGLIFEDGYLYEGTGRYGHSSLRKVELESGTVVQSYELSSDYFGEGITIFDNKIYQLTWESYTGFIYDKNSFLFIDNFYYSTEGWGLTTNGKYFIMSDGTAVLHFINPQSFEEITQVEVHDENGLVSNLNELELIDGEIYANVLPTDRIARIDPQTGLVNGWINLTGILGTERNAETDILNGIAYDSKNKRLFVTGKFWPKLFEIEIVPSR